MSYQEAFGVCIRVYDTSSSLFAYKYSIIFNLEWIYAAHYAMQNAL